MTPRLLDWSADPEAVSAASHLDAFRSLLLIHCAVQSWSWTFAPLIPQLAFPPAAIGIVAIALTTLGFASLIGHGRLASLIALPLVAWEIAWVFPFGANHNVLALVLLAMVVLLDTRVRDEERLLIQALRWIAVLIFFWAGAQKVLHGLYFQGEFLAWKIAQGSDRWAEIFGWMIPAEELQRLRFQATSLIWSGPYRVDSVPFVLVSNGVWIGEIAIGLGMLWHRTRVIAGLAAIGMVFVLQLAPREFMFALLYTNLLLLCVPGDWNRRALYAFALVYLYLVAVLLGAPGAFLLRVSGTI